MSKFNANSFPGNFFFTGWQIYLKLWLDPRKSDTIRIEFKHTKPTFKHAKKKQKNTN